MYPTIPILDRTVTNSFEFAGYRVEAGETVFAALRGNQAHRGGASPGAHGRNEPRGSSWLAFRAVRMDCFQEVRITRPECSKPGIAHDRLSTTGLDSEWNIP